MKNKLKLKNWYIKNILWHVPVSNYQLLLLAESLKPFSMLKIVTRNESRLTKKSETKKWNKNFETKSYRAPRISCLVIAAFWTWVFKDHIFSNYFKRFWLKWFFFVLFLLLIFDFYGFLSVNALFLSSKSWEMMQLFVKLQHVEKIRSQLASKTHFAFISFHLIDFGPSSYLHCGKK